MTPALRTPSWQHPTDHAQRTKHIGLKRARHVRVADVLDRSEQSVASVVDHHIQAAGELKRSCHGHFDCCRIPNVQSHAVKYTSALDDLRVTLADRTDHVVAAGQCSLGQSLTQAAGYASNEPVLHKISSNCPRVRVDEFGVHECGSTILASSPAGNTTGARAGD